MYSNGTIYVKKKIVINLEIKTSDGTRKVSEEEKRFLKALYPDLFSENKIDENFWLFFFNNDKVLMVNHEQGTHEVLDSLNDMEERFITLASFLNQSSYLGKKLILPAGTEFIKNGKLVLSTKPREEYIILYVLDDALIIKELKGKEEYRLISRFNPDFSKYVLADEINPEFNNKSQVYQAIIRQIYKKYRKEEQEKEKGRK